MPNTIEDQIIAKQNIRIQLYVALLAVVLFGIKAAAYWLTHSLAVYTDMMEGIVNIVAGLFGLFSLRFSAQPRDKKHPYGHGKIEFVSAMVEGSFIIMAGGLILFQVLSKLDQMPELAHLDIGIGLVLLTAVVNYAMGVIAVRKGRKTNSLALVASGKHLQSDTYSTLGIIIGLVAVKLSGFMWLDKVVAAVFALWIVIEGIKILKSSVGGILDEADPELIEEIVAYLNANRRDNWIDLHNLRVIKYGRILHIDAHMTVPGNMTVFEGHAELKAIEQLVQEKYGTSMEMFVHLDPGDPIREYPKIEWTVENVTQRHKHF